MYTLTHLNAIHVDLLTSDMVCVKVNTSFDGQSIGEQHQVAIIQHFIIYFQKHLTD